MNENFKEFEEEALNLPSKERAMLAIRLIESLDRVEDAEAERLWAEEALRRYRDYKKGLIPSRDVENAINDASMLFR